MISTVISIFTLSLALAAGTCLAQELQDPMRPPSFSGQAGGDPAEPSQFGPVLQSTLLSNGRRIAMIDGKPMKVGDKIGDGRIVAIDPATVTLREGKTTRVLEMFPGVKVTYPKPPESPRPQRAAKAQKSK
jgi:MSHA biogenesis protein MshK